MIPSTEAPNAINNDKLAGAGDATNNDKLAGAGDATNTTESGVRVQGPGYNVLVCTSVISTLLAIMF